MTEFKLVPMEPTEAMIEAARDQHEGEPYLPVSFYKAMLAAAPDVQGEVGEGVPDYINDAIDNLAHDNYELGYAGYLDRKKDIALIRAYVARSGKSAEQQPAPVEVPSFIELKKLAIEYGVMVGPILQGSRYAQLNESERFDAFVLALLARYGQPAEHHPSSDVPAQMDRLFCDLKTDEEKAAFFLSGMGYGTGVIALSIENDVAMAYQRCSEYRKEIDALQAECEKLRERMAEVKELLGFYLNGGSNYREDAERAEEIINEALAGGRHEPKER